MSATTAGELFAAIGNTAKLAYEILHLDQRELVDKDYAASLAEASEVVDALLETPLPGIEQRARIQLVIDGCLPAPFARLSPAQLARLNSERIIISKRDFVGLVEGNLLAKHLARILEVSALAPKE